MCQGNIYLALYSDQANVKKRKKGSTLSTYNTIRFQALQMHLAPIVLMTKTVMKMTLIHIKKTQAITNLTINLKDLDQLDPQDGKAQEDKVAQKDLKAHQEDRAVTVLINHSNS